MAEYFAGSTFICDSTAAPHSNKPTPQTIVAVATTKVELASRSPKVVRTTTARPPTDRTIELGT